MIRLVALAVLVSLTACTTAPRPLRVAAVFATPIEEPWDRAIHTAIEKQDVDYRYADSVTADDFEQTLRAYAAQTYDVIFGDAFAAEDAVRRVARDFPNIHFVFGSGRGPAEPNLSVFDNWIHEPAYLAGMIAGRRTTSGVIGVVGGFPVAEVNRLVHAFREGAREMRPDVRVKIAFIDSWFDPAKAKQAALAMIAQGVDVMYAERSGVIEACAGHGVPVIGNLIDQHAVAPDVVITSVVWDMTPTIEHVVHGIRAGTYEAKNLAEWSMMAKGGARLAPFYAWQTKLDRDTIAVVEQRRADIIAGRFRVPVIGTEPRSD